MNQPVIIGDATLYHGDCMDIFPMLTKVDAVITDPPYGINHKSNGQRFLGARTIDGDESLWSYAWLDGLNLPLVAFFSPYNPPSIKWRSVICWHKGVDVGIGGDRKTCWKRDIEMIGVSRNGPLTGGRDSALLQFRARQRFPSGHFCEKPVSLMEYLISKLPHEVILDPFMGSGTTGVACAKLGHPFIGIEKDKDYFYMACERVRQAQAQPDMFATNKPGDAYDQVALDYL